jgi:hypothetical protein
MWWKCPGISRNNAMQIKIKHVSIIDAGAFGVILCDEVPFGVTLERSYLEGTRQVTKIPAGTYRCEKRLYHRGGYWTFEILVPGHSSILFHKANRETELDGCIAIGEEYGILDGVPAILHCGNGGGFDEFLQKVSGLDVFDLVID